MKVKYTVGEQLFHAFVVLVTLMLSLAVVIPLMSIVFASFSDPFEVMKHSGIYWHPIKPSLYSYKMVFQTAQIWIAYRNPLLVIIFATAHEQYMGDAFEVYAFDYLLKPFHDGDLEKAVQRVQAKLAPKQTVLPEPKTGSGNRYVSEAIQYIKNHYQEPDISVSSVAQSLNISEGHLSHTFKKETGSTLLGYLTRYRIHKAAELLKDCRVKVYEVAEQVGYRDIGYFSNTFKKITGKTPSEYQDSLSFRF